MKKIKALANEIFIEGLSGMATGLFATLIIGTIIQQIGGLIPGTIGTLLFVIGKVAASVTGVGIGCGRVAGNRSRLSDDLLRLERKRCRL